jgi:hypothetical protein
MMSWLKHRGRTLATSPVRGMSVLVLMAQDTLLVACSSVESGSTVTRPAVSASPPAVVDPSSLPTITVIAHDFSFAMPTSLSAGLTVVKFVNAGTQANQAAFARLKHGITTNRVLALAKEGETVDYTQGDIVEAVRLTHPGGIDALIDVVRSRADLEHISQLLRPGGHLANTVHAADPARLAERGIKATNISLIRPTARLLRLVAQLVDADDLRVPIERAYPLEQAVEALRESEYGHVHGKIVLAID